MTTYFSTFLNHPEVHGLYKEFENLIDIKVSFDQDSGKGEKK